MRRFSVGVGGADDHAPAAKPAAAIATQAATTRVSLIFPPPLRFDGGEYRNGAQKAEDPPRRVFRTFRPASGCAYIIPLMSGIPAPAFSFSGASATMHSVVRMFFAIEAAFCSAERVTIVGSMMPALTRSS